MGEERIIKTRLDLGKWKRKPDFSYKETVPKKVKFLNRTFQMCFSAAFLCISFRDYSSTAKKDI